jgi:outer membrane receptor for monomeric catechols
MDTPQSVQVIGAEIITQQQAIRLSGSHQKHQWCLCRFR